MKHTPQEQQLKSLRELGKWLATKGLVQNRAVCGQAERDLISLRAQLKEAREALADIYSTAEANLETHNSALTHLAKEIMRLSAYAENDANSTPPPSNP